ASRLQARYRRLRDAIGTGEIGLHCAIGKALKGFCALMRGECRGATETHATGLGALATVACTGEDQLALEFGQPGKNSYHQAAMPAGRISPGVMQRLKACATLGDVIEDIEQVLGRACQAVEPGDDQHIPCVEALEHLSKLRSVAASAADLLGVDLGAARG